jgi:hypothetical protein
MSKREWVKFGNMKWISRFWRNKKYKSTNNCQPKISEEEEKSSVISFIIQNADVLAAIGLIGTMISLMPSFAEKH